MKLEQQVVSLELAKKLKELGVKQESLFYWIESHLVFKTATGFFNQLGAGMNLHPLADHAISAFTVAELGELLSTEENNNTVRTTKSFNQWGCDYEGNRTFGDNEADARAKMLVYLLENNLIQVK